MYTGSRLVVAVGYVRRGFRWVPMSAFLLFPFPTSMGVCSPIYLDYLMVYLSRRRSIIVSASH